MVFRIEEICNKVTSGGTPNTRKPEYYGGKIPWLKTQEVNFNRIYETETFITEEGLKNSSAKWIPANSVIVAMYGATAGRIAINKIPLTTNQACCNLTIDPEKADYRYIYYNLLSRFDSIANMAVGGAQQNLNAGMIKDLPIELPPLPTQKAIAEILSSLDDKIELNNQINQNLEALAQALFKQWFVDFEFPNENGEPYKSSGGEMIDSELGEIPKGWRVGTVGEISLNIRKTLNPTNADENTKYLGLEHLPQKRLGISSWDFSDKVTSQKSLFEENDILFGKLRPYFHKVIVAPFKGICSTDILVIRSKSWKNQSYLLMTLFSDELVSYATNVSGGTRMPRVNWSDIAAYKIPIPCESVFKRFNDSTSHFFELIKGNSMENKNLEQLREVLLPKLISGELEVNESLLEQTF